MNLKVTLNKTKQASPPRTYVSFLVKSTKDKSADMSHLDSDTAALATAAISEKIFSGDRKEQTVFRRVQDGQVQNLVLIGLGPAEKVDPEAIRSAAGAVWQALKSLKVRESVAIDLDALIHYGSDPGATTQAFVEGLVLSSYTFDAYKTAKKSEKALELVDLISTRTPAALLEKAKATGEVLGQCVNFSRELGDQPANHMTPDKLAQATQKAARGIAGLKVTVWNKAKIKKEGMGGLYGVSLGSDQEPRLIVLEYKGAGAKKKPVCFVGKGLTFDSGGISIKPSAGMEEMIYDMCGGANVIGTLLAIARLKLKVNAIGIVPATENMPGPGANKPGDILTARNGKTVEVFNTDAEGRLILMDALAYASEKKPAAIFDAATLTGAMLVALSNIHTGVFCRDRKVMEEVQKAADRTGELVWPMPIHDFHLEDMKGQHADLCNISSGKGAGSSTAAAFLGEFVDGSIPWAHFDIAGTAWNTSNRLNYVPKKGATGVMVRTFVELAKAYG